MDKKTENAINKQVYGLVARAVEDEFTNPCFQSADVERSITVNVGINTLAGGVSVEAILKTDEGDKRIAYEPIISLSSRELVRNDVQKFVIDCDITKAWADQLPKGYDVLDKETKDGRVANYKELLNLKSETVIVLVKDGVPVDRELVDKKIEELFPNPEPEEKKYEATASIPEQSSDYDIVEDDGTEDRDTSDVDVEPFGGYFAGGVERDDYDD